MPRKLNGKWYADKWITLPNGLRERIRKVSPINTKRGAAEFERQEVERRLNPAEDDGLLQKNFKEFFLSEFLEEYSRTNNSHAEYLSKESVGRMHLIPYFGKMDLSQINYKAVETFKKDQKKKELQPPTINNHLSVLRRALNEAIDLGYLEHIPRIKRLKEVVPPIDFLTYQELENLIEAAQPMRLKVMFRIAARAGLRLGELIALTRQNVDLNHRELSIVQAISRGRLGPTKDSDTRYVPISEETASVIRAYLAEKGQQAFQEYLFCNPDGRPYTPNQLKHGLLKAYEKAGLTSRRRRWHILRHTFASHCFMWGIPPEWVQQWMGHSDTKTTNRYAHLQRRYFEARPAQGTQPVTKSRAVLPWDISNRWQAISLLDQPPPWTATHVEDGDNVKEMKKS